MELILAKPVLITYDHTTERQIWLLSLDAIHDPFAWDEIAGQKFACLCTVDARSIPSERLSAFCSNLIRLGCAYFCAWGPDCERVHDSMDEEVIGNDPPATDLGCLMTTWHAEESLDEAVDFFRVGAIPDEEYAPGGCRHGLAIAIGSTEWAARIEEQLRRPMFAA